MYSHGEHHSGLFLLRKAAKPSAAAADMAMRTISIMLVFPGARGAP